MAPEDRTLDRQLGGTSCICLVAARSDHAGHRSDRDVEGVQRHRKAQSERLHHHLLGPGNLPHMGGGLYLRPRDMARIGQLVLDGGRWNGRQVVAEEWIAESTRRVVADAWAFGERPVDYGYLWWIADGAGSGKDPSGDIYIAAGSRGQWIIIVPEHEMVVVATGWESNDKWVAPVDLVYSHVIPAVR